MREQTEGSFGNDPAVNQALTMFFWDMGITRSTADFLILKANEALSSPDKNAIHQLIRQIDEYFQKEKFEASEGLDSPRFKRIEELKKEILFNSPFSNWKDALLNVHYQPISRSFLETTEVYPDFEAADIQLNNPERFKPLFRKKNVCSISGSSFATNNRSKLAGSLDESGSPKSSVLDASYTASTSDGWVLAVADGCGHQYANVENNEIDRDEYYAAKKQNEDIGRTAYFAAKHACRLMASYPDAQSLSASLKELKERVSEELPVKVRAHRGKPLAISKKEEHEKTTLVCGRVFRETPSSFRFVGFNIGDSMLIAFNPQTKTFQTIGKARQVFRMLNTASPAALPDLCENDMITFDTLLPTGTIVFGLTDGVWDYLPQLKNPKEDQKKSGRIDTEIDFNTLMNDPDFILPKRITLSRLTQAFADYSLKKTEHEQERLFLNAGVNGASIPVLERELSELQDAGKKYSDPEVEEKIANLEEAKLSQKLSIGDDYTLVGMELSPEPDLTPDYTNAEIAISILTLGLYALIKDCLHIGTNDEISLGDGVKAAALVSGFFGTGGALGLGYLGYKAIRECLPDQPEEPKIPKVPI